jgi:glycosyltransferase involved in cell wall biosynthesis
MSVYNGEAHLAESMESILAQEGVDFEFIVVDDGSTDNTQEILKRYAESDDRVRVLTQPGNQGLTRALIRGCAAARGEFVARQDADDISLPHRLKSLSLLLRSDSRLSFVSSWTRRMAPEGETITEFKRPYDPLEATRKLYQEGLGPPGHGSVMFRKSAYEYVGGYRDAFYYAQDTDLWLRLGEMGLFGYEQAFLYQYRYSLTSISAEWKDIQDRFHEIARACHAVRKQGGEEAELLHAAVTLTETIRAGNADRKPSNKRMAEAAYHLGCGLLDVRNPKAEIYFRSALKLDPFHLRAWIKWLFSIFLKNHVRER